MEVFLSWSGARSKGVATAFYEWLPSVLQEVHPFLSSESISKGETWLNSIRDALSASNGMGLFFLTQEAMTSPWLLFEAGGIAALGVQRVCTVCIDVAPHDLTPPLNFFQATVLERTEVERLVEDLNKMLPRPVAPHYLKKTFERSWSDLETQLKLLETQTPAVKPKPKVEPDATATIESAVLDTLRRIEGRLGALESGQRNLALSTGNITVTRPAGGGTPHSVSEIVRFSDLSTASIAAGIANGTVVFGPGTPKNIVGLTGGPALDAGTVTFTSAAGSSQIKPSDSKS